MSDATLPRQHLLRALHADLVGPFVPPVDDEPDTCVETLELPPSRWYLTGFLVPATGDTVDEDPTADDLLGAGDDEDSEEGGKPEPQPQQKNRFPSSLGLTVLLPPGPTTDTVRATLRYADYLPIAEPQPGRKHDKILWQRAPRPPVVATLTLDPDSLAKGQILDDTGGLWLGGKLETLSGRGLPTGTRVLSLFVVNRREPGVKGRHDTQYAFQVQLQVEHAAGLLARPDQHELDARLWDAKVADLQFRDRREHAVGHGVSVHVPPGQDPVARAATTWLPSQEVRRVVTHELPQVDTRMDRLAGLASGDVARAALDPLIPAYRAWIAEQRDVELDVQQRRETRDQLMADAERACKRIEQGLTLLAADPQVFEAFCLANRAMHMAATKRPGWVGEPRWRLFQLAFVLLNLPGIADPAHDDRELVDLIYFPTGGGKTEAYLGVIAFALILRRLRGRERPDQGLGVAVLLRYTLRLLTLDQLGRAATLICALELLRRQDPKKLGDVRFAVGLWIGAKATANTLERVAKDITEYKNSSARGASSPFPLTSCPWCGHPLDQNSLTLKPDRVHPKEVVVACVGRDCEFTAARNAQGLPVLFVDEQIYRELPCFVLATVDKFAMLPWRGETGMLFGRVQARQDRSMFGPMDTVPATATKVPGGLRPPELIVQDELHLIAGPLGTMVGLYETAIDALCAVDDGGTLRRPKVIASTATVKRARHQVRALFGRQQMAVFPPPGVDPNQTFFARVDDQGPGRMYLGVAAPGRSMKQLTARVYMTLLAAAQHLWDPAAGPEQTADAYTTLVGYFGSLRELGGTRRLVEDEIRARVAMATRRRPRSHTGPHPWCTDRKIALEPVELTSRESTAKVKDARARLAKHHDDKERVDVALATNMISVGLDIDRLGLMVVTGQPKTTSEYIQATSRVGRQSRWPGLVVTCHNLFRPRDRSHYERFAAFHQSFYRHVEAMSLTPFSGPALARGLAGTLIALARLLDPGMTSPAAAMRLLTQDPAYRERVARIVAERAAGHGESTPAGDHEAVLKVMRQRCANLFDAWLNLVDEAQKGAGARCYSRFDLEHPGKPLLYMVLDDQLPMPGTDDEKFAAPTSMRDVEHEVHLWMDRNKLGARNG